MKWLILAVTVMTWPLISFGALVRLHNSGLSCPDWPLCYGKLIPPPGFEIAMEVGHRFWATLIGILVVVMTVMTFRIKKYRQFRHLSLICLILISFQGILGGLTVTMVLWPPVVTFHLIGGNILFGLMIYITWLTFHYQSPDDRWINTFCFSLLGKRICIMLGLLMIIVVSGGYNSSTYSGYACEAFPGCHEGSTGSFGMSGTLFGDTEILAAPEDLQGKFFPKYTNEWIHMFHRLIALIGSMGLMLMALRWLTIQGKPSLSFCGWGVFVMIPIEFLVGVANALFRVPVSISVLHTTIASILVGILSYALVQAFHRHPSELLIHLKKQ